MNDNQNHDGKETPPGSEDNSPQVRFTERGRSSLHYKGGSHVLRSSIQHPWGQSERIGRDDGPGDYLSRGGEIVGGTLSQLVQDCKDQIAGNEKIINSLQETNDLLQERVSHYEQLLSRIQE